MDDPLDRDPPGPTRGWWDDFRIAAQFLTRLPIRAPAGPPLAEAARAFPLVGLAVGVGGALAFWLALLLGLPPLAAALLAIATTVLLTGALHEDGLADVADGFGAGGTRERTLAIMRDSRIGTFGTLALILDIGLRAAALAALAGTGTASAALIAAAAASRGFLPAIMHALPLARADGLAVAAGRASRSAARTAGLLGIGIALVLLLLAGALGAGIVAVLLGGIAAALVGRFAERRIGGYTGDVLGAAQRAAETAMLLAVAMVAA